MVKELYVYANELSLVQIGGQICMFM